MIIEMEKLTLLDAHATTKDIMFSKQRWFEFMDNHADYWLIYWLLGYNIKAFQT